MRLWLSVLFVVLVALVMVATQPACSSTPSNSSAAGREGWIRVKDEPGQSLEVERGGETVVIRRGDTSTEYCIVAKPALFHSASAIAVPVFSGSSLLRSTSYLYKEHRFYSIPEGKSFQEVYNWYMTWFEFKDRQ